MQLHILDFHRNFSKKGETDLSCRRGEAFVRVLPILKQNGDPENDVKYHRQQVILYYSFRQQKLENPGEVELYTSWAEAFNGLGLRHPPILEFPESMEKGEVIEGINQSDTIEPYMTPASITESSRENTLGRRLVDAAYD